MDTIVLYFSDVDDSDTENEKSNLRYRSLRDKSNIFEIPDTMFMKLFRLPKDAVKYILNEINDHLPIRARATSIPNIIKLAATLRFCAQGSYQQSVGQDYLVGLSQSSVSLSLHEVLSVMEEKVCPKWISFRLTRQEKQEAANHFYAATGFPGVIGCVDGTHINIVRPIENENLYFNRKGAHSLNTMIVCDHKTKIMAVDSRYGGASHDSLVWSLSTYRQYWQQQFGNNENSNYRVLGDSGYPLEPWLLTPYRATSEGSREARFNTIHSKTRNVIERCIGILKSRFRCLLKARTLHYTPKKASQIINVCTALHNICLHYTVPFDSDEIIVDAETQIEVDVSNSNNENSVAQQIRNSILNSIT